VLLILGAAILSVTMSGLMRIVMRSALRAIVAEQTAALLLASTLRILAVATWEIGGIVLAALLRHAAMKADTPYCAAQLRSLEPMTRRLCELSLPCLPPW
jgi:hypothetical protein